MNSTSEILSPQNNRKLTPLEITFPIKLLQVNLKLLRNLLVVQGDSAIGKTWVFKELQELSKARLYEEFNDLSLAYFDYSSEFEDILKCAKKIIVLDNADILFEKYPDLQELVISNSINNRHIYLVIGRSLNLGVGPAGLVNFCRDGKQLFFDYAAGREWGVIDE